MARPYGSETGNKTVSHDCLPKSCQFTATDEYVRGREPQADKLFEECLEIADDTSGDYIEKKNDDGSTFWAVDHEHIQRSKLRIDTRKWMAGKLAPKKYGEKVAQKIIGSGG